MKRREVFSVYTGDPLKPYLDVTVEQGLDYVSVHIEGTGTSTETDGAPIIIEVGDDEKPRLIVWADINEENATHIIDMGGAMESNYKGEC